MASLQKIRNHGGLLIAVVGIAMLAFILGDLLNNSGSLLHRNQDKLGSVAGNTISMQEFENARERLERLVENREGINQTTWSTFVQYYTYKAQADKMGMSISQEELDRIASQFAPGIPMHVAEGEYLRVKYDALLRNCLQVNSLETEFAFNSRQHGVSADYVMLPYDAIADSLVDVRESDIQAMYNKYKQQLKREPYRAIEYIVINYAPSDADFVKEAEHMASLQEDFRTAEDIDDMLSFYDSDTAFQEVKSYTLETVPAEFKDFAFGSEAAVGACSEIQFDGQAYAMARIVAINKAAKTVDLAILKRTVITSEATKVDLEQQYTMFIHENSSLEEFEQAAKEAGLATQMATVEELTQKVGNMDDSRKIVNWAFTAAEGAVCKEIFECGEKIVIAAVVEASDSKFVPLEKVRSQLAFMAKNEAKAAYIAELIPSANSLEEVAERFNRPIESIARVALADNLFGSDYEPAVVGAAIAQKENAISAPIKGNMGVYFVKTGAAMDMNAAYDEAAAAAEKEQLSKVMGNVYQSALQYLSEKTAIDLFFPERL